MSPDKTEPSEPKPEPKPAEGVSGVPQEGDVLAGKYEVERILGLGGMGVVVAARHIQLDTKVAVKFLLPEAKEAEAAERFSREAKAALEIKSEHVARVTDFGTLENGCPFIVMEYLEGSDLKHQLERGPMEIPAVVEYVLQACEALAEAHHLGIVHRDLKPANLFLTWRADGTPLVKVLDFGISKAVSLASTGAASRGLTRTNTMLGTPSYMSPEQVRDSKHVDQRTDVWALGVIMYELLTGSLPFNADNITAISAQIVVDTPKALTQLRTEIPEGLETAVLRCLEKETDQRFQNVAELAEALAEFAPEGAHVSIKRIKRLSSPELAFGATVQASVPGQTMPMSKTAIGWGMTQAPAKRRTLTILGGVAVLAVLIGGWLLLGRDASERDASAPAPVQPAAPQAPAASFQLHPAASQVPSAAAAAASASAAATAPAAKDESPAKPAPKRRPAASKKKCGPGQVLSKGHCCPIGLVWEDGRCKRPLATAVPF